VGEKNALRDAMSWLFPWRLAAAHREHSYPGRYKGYAGFAEWGGLQAFD
jgi:hypothetical protein